jgi:hypothetical protein
MSSHTFKTFFLFYETGFWYYVQLCVCTLPAITNLDRTMDFHKTLYMQHATTGNPLFTLFNFLPT